MRARHLLFCIISVSLSACTLSSRKNVAEVVVKDTLNYTYKTINRRIPGSGNRPDSSCAEINIKYPVFIDERRLNDTITDHLVNIIEFGNFSKQAITSLDQLADSIIKTSEGGVGYTLNLFAKVRHQDSSLTTLEYGVRLYHGSTNYQNNFINWNTKTRKEITLNDIFNNGYHEPLNKIAEKIFRKDEKLTDIASLAKAYRFYKNKFGLNENFMITPTGIFFLYNLYEIRPSEGQTTLFIPYSKIKHLLRPNTVITQYLK